MKLAIRPAPATLSHAKNDHALLLRSWSPHPSPTDRNLPVVDDQLVCGRVRISHLADSGLLHGANDRTLVLSRAKHLCRHLGGFPDRGPDHRHPDRRVTRDEKEEVGLI